MSRTGSKATYHIFAVLAIASLGGIAYLGWNWLDGLVCTRVVADGYTYAEEDELLAVARVDTGVRLLDIDPSVIKDRVERHPWVRNATVRRLPPGTVSIDVVERVPVALATDGHGRPAVFLDAAGYVMPVKPEAVFDVPLVHGLELPKNATQQISTESVRNLVRSLENLDAQADALTSSFAVDPTGEITLHTVPVGGREAVAVRLGRRGFTEKFARLTAFWEQAVLSRPDVTYDLIDLRFDSQIVTRET